MRTTYEAHEAERVETVIIGAGQAGLSVGHHLARRGRTFVILDANERVGDSWRQRWDSLRLFSPARFDGLDGMRFPGSPHDFPTKDEMADYLEAYAARFELPVRGGVRVTSVSRQGDRYLVVGTGVRLEADDVVVAMANYQTPKVPAFAADLDPSIRQMHSSAYRNLGQLRPGGVLVVGAGNSGAEIAIEAVRAGHETWLSGKDVGAVPFDFRSALGRNVFLPVLFRGVFHRLLTLDTPVGRKVRPKALHHAAPLIRTKPNDLAKAGVRRVGRTTGVVAGSPVVEGGQIMDVANVIWCTGYHGGFSWIEVPVFDADGEPLQDRGVVRGEPGLYFVGLHFLYAMSSTMIHGVGRDADHVAEVIARRRRASGGPPVPIELAAHVSSAA
jgi:putative flavoprotein involved in K+ transport